MQYASTDRLWNSARGHFTNKKSNQMYGKCVVIGLCLTVTAACAQQGDRVVLGRLETGATVSFIRAAGGTWGIEISGGAAPRLTQQKPAQIEIFQGEENVRQIAAGYNSVQKQSDTVIARATVVGGGGAAFDVEDRWTVSGDVLSLGRKVQVTGTEDNAGFCSAIRLSTGHPVNWEDADYFAPGLLYGDPTYDGDSSPGGTLNYRARRFSIREDLMSAPLFALLFRNGSWAAVLDLAPSGETIMAESNAPTDTPVIDERIQFGALGARGVPGGGVEFGFWLPGTTNEFRGGFEAMGAGTATPVVRRRYHPVKAGLSQSYQVGFRFGQDDSFRAMERNAWRWAWESLKPKVTPVDVEAVRRSLIDHLADHVVIAGNLAGVPFLYDAMTGKPGSYRSMTVRRPGGPSAPTTHPANAPPMRNELTPEASRALAEWARTVGVDLDPQAHELELWPKIIMSFCSKGIESADQLLQEGDRDPGPRGQRMRKLGLMIIESFVRLVPMSPPAGEGFNLWTGKPDCGAAGIFTLRAPSEDMRTLIQAYRREKLRGREHPEWLRWCQQFADWMLPQQRKDGSFPRSWNAGTGTVCEASGTSSCNPVPLLVALHVETGQKKYLLSALRAADYIWENFGSHGVFIGGATDNPNIVDKEGGMLALEAYLSLYETTKDPRWLERAQTAGNFDESWIWIWNVPMPLDANDSTLHWKRGVPTVGVQGITARVAGGVDQYLAWAVPANARLFEYTKEKHYLDVARILLHDTKAMLALPGRTYDLLGPGWQQEHWQMGPRRGYGMHRSWLPWVSVNHLHGITGLEEFDTALFQRLARGE
jgi:hypothetical protein